MPDHVWETVSEMTQTCTKCKQKKGNIYTKECPDRQLDEKEAMQIQNQELDYAEGKWKRYAKIF